MSWPETLETPRLSLVRPQTRHAAALGEAVEASLPDLAPVFRWAEVHQRFERGADASAHLHDRIVAWEEGRQRTWFAFDGADRLVAEIMLKLEDWERARAVEYVVWVRSDCCGCGVGSEASDAVFAALFGELEAELVEARVAPSNPASRRLMRALGFERHGHRHDYDRLVLFPMAWARAHYARLERRRARESAVSGG